MKVRALRNLTIGGKQRNAGDVFDCEPGLVPGLTKPRPGAPKGYVEVISPPVTAGGSYPKPRCKKGKKGDW